MYTVRCPETSDHDMARMPSPVFESYQHLPLAEHNGDNAAIERHPQSEGIYARLECGGKLWLMDDASQQPGRYTNKLATTEPTTLLCVLTGDATAGLEEHVRPTLCWAPALGQNVVLASSDGWTIEHWHAKRDLRHIARKAIFSPYHNSDISGSINSVSCDSGGEYCMVSDELRVFMWKLERLNHRQRPQVALDLTPADDEELCEVITCTRFHPIDCGTIVVGFDTGRVAIYDISTTKHLGKSLYELEVAADHEGTLEQFAAPVTHLAFSEDATTLYVCNEMRVHVYTTPGK
jgi:WD40 repeat protein